MENDLMKFYNDPSIAQAGNDAASAGQTAGAYQSAASLLPAKLRQAVEEKINYNKDIIDSKNKAQADYFAAPATAREQYQGIFNPFTREKLVAQAVGNAYTPYASLTDILGERTGAISDIINSGVGAFNSSVGAAQNEAQTAQQRYQQLLDLADRQTKLSQWSYEQTHARPSSAGAKSPLEQFLEAQIMKAISGGGSAQPTEPEPLYTPRQGEGTLSPGGQYIFHAGEWMVNTEGL